MRLGTQPPSEHVVALAQVIPHPPQLLESPSRSVQKPAPVESRHELRPAGHEPVQAPCTQNVADAQA
jgi:hypothetical protein